jgi:hypothetical protein
MARHRNKEKELEVAFPNVVPPLRHGSTPVGVYSYGDRTGDQSTDWII